mgnify:FL=1
MVKGVIFDMDGTIASLYDVPDWLKKIRNEDTSPYLDAAPMWDMAELSTILNKLLEIGVEVKIVSWCAKHATKTYDDEVRKAKREWLKKFDFPCSSCRITPYGYPKEYLRNKNRINILIDDNKEVRKSFRRFDGCETIDPTKIDIVEWLKSLME